MSSDLQPLPGPDLDTAARTGAEADDGVGKRRPAAEPSLVRVLGTTLRLWLRRRVLRVPDGAPAGVIRWAALAAVVLVVLGAASGGLAAGLARSSSPPPRPRHHQSVPAPNPVQTLTTANEQAAAAWVVAQAAASSSVVCDPTMCGYLQADGLTVSRQVLVAPGASLPPGAGIVVVATPTVRGQFAAALASRALDVIASFGTGQAEVQVRVTTTATAAKYLAAARRELAADAKTGRVLAANPRLHLSRTARRQLVSGYVDPRLLVVLGRLLVAQQLYVPSFGAPGPGGSWPDLLRSVTVNRLVRGTGKHRVNAAPALLRLLRAQHPPYRASLLEQSLPGGLTLTVQFAAPSPL